MNTLIKIYWTVLLSMIFFWPQMVGTWVAFAVRSYFDVMTGKIFG